VGVRARVCVRFPFYLIIVPVPVVLAVAKKRIQKDYCRIAPQAK
jgi:hypothetical protein